jgi:hypothetical protein
MRWKLFIFIGVSFVFMFFPIVTKDTKYLSSKEPFTDNAWAYGEWESSFFLKKSIDPYDLIAVTDFENVGNLRVYCGNKIIKEVYDLKASTRKDGQKVVRVTGIHFNNCEKVTIQMVSGGVEKKYHLNKKTERKITPFIFHVTSGV